MNCEMRKTCAHYRVKCGECDALSSPLGRHPFYTEKNMTKPKFVIFFGSQTATRADGKLNEWLKMHPNVHIISYQYQATQVGHSICIMYVEDMRAVYDYDDRDYSGLLEED